MTKPTIWTKYRHRHLSLLMEVTQVSRGYVTLWDKPMLFKWHGTLRQFHRNYKPA